MLIYSYRIFGGWEHVSPVPLGGSAIVYLAGEEDYSPILFLTFYVYIGTFVALRYYIHLSCQVAEFISYDDTLKRKCITSSS